MGGNKMSDTPETNSIIRNAQASDHPPTRLAATLTVKCEKLERERDEARDDILGWENKWKCAIDMAARAELERDEALEDAKKYHIKMVNLINERNDARELAQQMSESNQVLQAEVRDYRKKEKANPFYKY
jgi:hypothetical protein